MNEELITSAVSFLQDQTVAASPIKKKIEFLQSKGLNEEEIDEAIKRANDPTPSSNSPQKTSATSYKGAIQEQQQQPPHTYAPLDYYSVAPQVPERTWKDYFIMATATAGVTYGFYQVVSRYLLPSIIPPGRSRLDDDKQVVEEEFIKIDKVLEQMSLEQKEIKEANQAKLSEIDSVIGNVREFLAKYEKDKVKFDDDLRLIKLEVDNLQNSIEKNMRLTKDNIHDELSDISTELESLKNLIKIRGGVSGAPERKVAPVSSIPSASEILKKAKANSAVNSANNPANNSNGNGTPKVESNSHGSVAIPENPPQNVSETQPAVMTTAFPPTSASAQSNGGLPHFLAQKEFHAAGIPDWQLAHKKREEESEQAGSSSESQDKKSLNGDDQKVQQSISKVGVPEWQLSASSK